MYSENMKNSIQCKYLTYEQFSLNQYYNLQRHTLLILLHTNWVEFLSFIANYTNFDKFSTMFFLLFTHQWTDNSKTKTARVFILAHDAHFDNLSSSVKN